MLPVHRGVVKMVTLGKYLLKVCERRRSNLEYLAGAPKVCAYLLKQSLSIT